MKVLSRYLHGNTKEDQEISRISQGPGWVSKEAHPEYGFSPLLSAFCGVGSEILCSF